jgi:chemotaxis protein CheX
MNVKFLNPFVDAAFEVLKIETGIEANRGDLRLEKGPYLTQDVTVIISLVGSVEGTVFYCLNLKTAIQLASRMIGETLKEFDSLAQSGIAELGNVITGRASVKLSEAQFEATISPPSLILGNGATISTLDFPRLVVPVITEFGEIQIHLALRDGVNTRKTPQLQIPSRPV